MTGPEPRRVVLLGATGAVGRNVLRELLRSPAVASVTTLGRRPAAIDEGETSGEQLTQHIVNLEAPGSYRALLGGHAGLG